MNAEEIRFQKKLDSIPLVRKMENRVIRFFPDTNLRNGHKGLTDLALSQGLKLDDLAWGEFVIFMNKRQTDLKMFSNGGLLAHLKMPNGARIDFRVISLIPRFLMELGSIILEPWSISLKES